MENSYPGWVSPPSAAITLAVVVRGKPVRGEEHVGRRQLVGMGGPPCRCVLAEGFDVLFGHRGRDQRCPHRTGRDAVDPDPPRCQCLRHRIGPGVDRALGGGVVDELLVAPQPVHRRGVDDHRTFAEVRQRPPRHPETAVDVDVEGVQPLLLGQLVRRLEFRLGGHVVDQQVQTTQEADRVVHDVAAVVGAGEIAGQQHALPPLFAHQFRGVLGVGVLGQVGDRDVGALLGEGHRDGPADSRVAPGDQRAAVPQQVPADVVVHLVPGFRAHLGGAARGFLFLWRLAHTAGVLDPAGTKTRG